MKIYNVNNHTTGASFSKNQTKKGKPNYYKNKPQKSKTVSLEFIYGLQDNTETEDKCSEVGCNYQDEQKFLEEIGRLSSRKKNS